MKLLILSCFIAGLPHRQPDLSKLGIGTEVALIPDPKNQFDPLAIEVHAGNQMLGFVPREQTLVIHSAFAANKILTTSIVEMPMTKWKEILIQASIEI